jgi:lysyl-tRNA synthetase class 2
VTVSEIEDTRLRAERLRKLAQLKEEGVDPYPYKFSRTHLAADLQKAYQDLAKDTETQDVVRICGRVMNERNTWMFVDVYDESGKIQLFCHKETLPDSS